MITNLFVEKGETKPESDLIYMKPLDFALKKILEWYYDTGKTILDVTAGERRIWSKDINATSLLTGDKSWSVTFLDQSPEAKAEILADFTKLPFADNSFDVIIFDPPFIKQANGVESFGIKTHKTPDRNFYFRQKNDEWIPPEEYFKLTWKEFNRVSKNGLIVKIAERYEKGYEIPVTTYMDLCYDKRFNPLSEFQRISRVGYRGKRAGLGAKMIHPQRVLSYYANYKKDYKLR